MAGDDLIEYHGVLVRSAFTPERATMRFLDTLQPNFEADRPVLVVTFDEPAFTGKDMPDFMADDVQLVITSRRLDVAELYGNRTAALAGGHVSAVLEAYDVEDLKMFLHRAADREERDWHALKRAREIINTGVNLIVELLRRAEIKASASDALQEKQTAAIAALNRLLVHFKASD